MTTSKRFLSVLVILVAIICAVPTLAQNFDPEPQVGIPDLVLSTATSAGGWIYICPLGDGETLASVGATITVTLVDGVGAPVTNFPFGDIRIESIVSGELVFCADGNTADANTDAMGRTTFSGTFIGGGCTQGGLQVVINGAPLVGSPLAIDVNSPDINGDLRIDLCDYALLGTNYFGGYSFCADYTHDLTLSLPDVAIFAHHMCDVCPGGTPPPTVTSSGEIGIFFDMAGTVTGTMGIVPFVNFDFYVVALSAPGNIQAFQFGLTHDPNIMLLTKMVKPDGSLDLSGGNNKTDVIAVPLGGCLQVAGPTVLAHYQAMALTTLTDSPLCLGPPSTYPCQFNPPGPAYLSCLNDCDWRQFYPAYQGCAYINGMGPVATETTSWGQVKALYRY